MGIELPEQDIRQLLRKHKTTDPYHTALMEDIFQRVADSSSGESDTETGGFDGPARISATGQSLIRWWLVNLRRRMAEEGERMIAESIEQARSQLPQAPTGDDGFPDDDEFTDSSDDNFPVAQMSTDPTYTTSDPNAGRGGSSDDSNLDSSD